MKTIEQKITLPIYIEKHHIPSCIRLMQGDDNLIIENNKVLVLIQTLLPEGKAIIDAPQFEGSTMTKEEWIGRALPILRGMKEANIQALMFKYERGSLDNFLDWDRELNNAKKYHFTLTELMRVAEDVFKITEEE